MLQYMWPRSMWWKICSTEIATKSRHVSEKNFQLLSTALDNLHADVDVNLFENVAADLFFGVANSAEVAENISAILLNVEYITDQTDLLKYNIWDEDIATSIFSLIEKFSVTL